MKDLVLNRYGFDSMHMDESVGVSVQEIHIKIKHDIRILSQTVQS